MDCDHAFHFFSLLSGETNIHSVALYSSSLSIRRMCTSQSEIFLSFAIRLVAEISNLWQTKICIKTDAKIYALQIHSKN